MSYTYQLAILGGTFDHFHLGHKNFLKTAFSQSKHILIGIVKTPNKKSYLESIEGYILRKKNLLSYLQELKLISRATIVPINDIYGPSLTNQNIEVIFVTEATYANAVIINHERKKRAMPKFKIILVSYTHGDDKSIISSRRIRGGEINSEGQSLLQFFLAKDAYHLPNALRKSLQHPLGKTVSKISEISKVIPDLSNTISVGDIVSLNLQMLGYHPAISIIDYRTRRNEIDKETIKTHFPTIHHTLINPAGTINTKIAKLLNSSRVAYEKTQETQVIAVNGEEDLLALPAILLAPLNTYVVYGIYNQGICIVQVTERTKARVKEYLAQFE